MSSYAEWIGEGSTCNRTSSAAQNCAVSFAVAQSVSSAAASNSGTRHTGSPSLRQCAYSAQRGSCSPGFTGYRLQRGPRRPEFAQSAHQPVGQTLLVAIV